MPSEAQKRANRKYKKKTGYDVKYVKDNYDVAVVLFRKDAVLTVDMVKDYAAFWGESLNGFLLRVIREAVERDKRGGTDGQ